jgi:hypothetical protein
MVAFFAAESFAKEAKKKKKKKGKEGESGEMTPPAGERPWGMAGCGIGAVLMGADGIQVLASTTNGSFGQSYSVTTGSSNCVEMGAAAARHQQEQFMFSNLSSLRKEVSQGDGPSITAFADTLGCSQEVRPEVAKTMQNAYSDIFRSPGAMAILHSAKLELGKAQSLVQSCKHLSV